MTVIIVGAGAAGLTAAYTLAQNGRTDFQILEADDRFGGRLMKSDSFASHPMDLGGEFVHVRPTVFDDILQVDGASQRIETVRYQPGYKEWTGSRFIDESYGVTTDFLFVDYSWYDFVNDHIVAPENLESSIQYGCKVTDITYADPYASVKCQDGRVFGDATEVIVTTPISVLQEGSIRFTPSLPSSYNTAIQAPSFPAGIKIFLKFSTQFYPEAFSLWSDYEGTLSCESERFFFDETYGQVDQPGEYILGIFSYGTPATQVAGQSDSRLIQDTLSELDGIFDGAATASFVEGLVQNWEQEPFIQGAYSCYEGRTWRYIDTLREPINRKLWFAGEAIPVPGTDYANGYAHGAALSGQYAAWDVLKNNPAPPPPTPNPTPLPTPNPTPNATPAPTPQPTPDPTPPPTTTSPVGGQQTARPTPAPTLGNEQQPSCSGLQHRFELQLLTDDYPEETSWRLFDTDSREVVASGSTYSETKLYKETVCLENGNYEFTINDSYSDGICCNYGAGEFSVYLEGQIVGSGAAFGSSQSMIPFSVISSSGDGGDSEPPPPEEVCEDDSTWTYTSRSGRIRDCTWIGKRANRRCSKTGDDGRLAMDACPESCSSC